VKQQNSRDMDLSKIMNYMVLAKENLSPLAQSHPTSFIFCRISAKKPLCDVVGLPERQSPFILGRALSIR